MEARNSNWKSLAFGLLFFLLVIDGVSIVTADERSILKRLPNADHYQIRLGRPESTSTRAAETDGPSYPTNSPAISAAQTGGDRVDESAGHVSEFSRPRMYRIASRNLEIDRNSEPLGIDFDYDNESSPTIVPIEPLVTERTLPGSLRISSSVIGRTKQLNEKAIDAARRRAYFSARAHFIRALQSVSRAADAAAGTNYHSMALSDGLKALDEAKDFSPNGSQLDADLNLQQIVSSHRTPVMKDKDLDRVTTLEVLQAYHEYGRRQLTNASANLPVASVALAGLARLQPFLSEEGNVSDSSTIPRSMTMYQAALEIDKTNTLAANELGILFARFGQLEDAKMALTHCITIDPNQPTAWQNLARVHQELGESDFAAAAHEEFLLAKKFAEPTDRISLEWVDNKTFSAGSPKAVNTAQRLSNHGTSSSASSWIGADRTDLNNDSSEKRVRGSSMPVRLPGWLNRSKAKQ